MVVFRFAPLNTAEASSDALAQLEIAALFHGSADPSAVLLDKDSALTHFIDTHVREEDRENYRSEPEQAEGEMYDMFCSDLISLAKERSEAIGDLYPFSVDRQRLTVKDTALHAVAVAYLSIQAMRLAQRELVEVVSNTEESRRRDVVTFRSFFERVFEFASAYTVSGHKGGMPIVLSNCRSYIDLHKKLNGICRKVGNGQVRTLDNWSRLQKAANDGGVDAIVHTGGKASDGNTTLLLIGATYQQSRIGSKIIDQTARNRFAEFFVDRPAPIQGVLVRLAEADEFTIEKCRREDCLFYGYEGVWKNIGRRPAASVDLRMLGRIDASMLRNLRGYIRKFGTFTMVANDGEQIVFPHQLPA